MLLFHRVILPELKVGDVAKRAGFKISTLHFYEQIGLIKSYRNEGNQRRFTKDVLRRVATIKAAQKVGLSLDAIQEAFATLPENRTPTKSDWNKLARQWQSELDKKISYLIKLRDSLTSCIGCGCLSLKACPIYNDNDKLAEYGKGPVILDD